MYKKIILSSLTIYAVLSLTACNLNNKTKKRGIESSSQKMTRIGYYGNMPIQGVDYKCASQSGKTGEDGKFIYEKGKKCVFSIAGLQYREISADKLNNEGVKIDENDIDVVRFLISVDDDSNATNGIQISDETSAKLKSVAEATENKEELFKNESVSTKIIKNSLDRTLISEHDAFKFIGNRTLSEKRDNTYQEFKKAKKGTISENEILETVKHYISKAKDEAIKQEIKKYIDKIANSDLSLKVKETQENKPDFKNGEPVIEDCESGTIELRKTNLYTLSAKQCKIGGLTLNGEFTLVDFNLKAGAKLLATASNSQNSVKLTSSFKTYVNAKINNNLTLTSDDGKINIAIQNLQLVETDTVAYDEDSNNNSKKTTTFQSILSTVSFDSAHIQILDEKLDIKNFTLLLNEQHNSINPSTDKVENMLTAMYNINNQKWILLEIQNKNVDNLFNKTIKLKSNNSLTYTQKGLKADIIKDYDTIKTTIPYNEDKIFYFNSKEEQDAIEKDIENIKKDYEDMLKQLSNK